MYEALCDIPQILACPKFSKLLVKEVSWSCLILEPEIAERKKQEEQKVKRFAEKKQVEKEQVGQKKQVANEVMAMPT